MMSSEQTFDLYYVLPQQIYEKLAAKTEKMDLTLNNFPKRAVKRIKALLNYLSASNVQWNILGFVDSKEGSIPVSWNALEYCNYAVTAKGLRPEYFQSFLELVIKLDVPIKTFHAAVQREIIKRKRQLKREAKLVSQKSENENEKEIYAG